MTLVKKTVVRGLLYPYEIHKQESLTMHDFINFLGAKSFFFPITRLGWGTNIKQQWLLFMEICRFVAKIYLTWKLEVYTNIHRPNPPIIPTF